MSDYRVFKLGIRENVLLALVSFLGSGIIGILFYNTILGIALSPAVFLVLKKPLERTLLERRRQDLRNQFRDVLYSFSASFAAGLHMEEAMEHAVNSLSELYGHDSDMVKELEYMTRKMRDAAKSDVELWNDLALRTNIEDIRDFASVFSACREAGGNLVEAIDRAAAIIVDKINIENEMRLMFSQKKMEGHMVGIMPIVIIGFMRMSSPGYLEIMYLSIVGRLMMSLAIISIGIAMYLTERITRVDI